MNHNNGISENSQAGPAAGMPVKEAGTAFTPTQRTRLKRVAQRAVFERERVYPILDEAWFCHVGFVQAGTPVVIPTAHWRDGDRLYIHGSAASRMLEALAAGAEACITVTLLDGFVLARSAFHHSLNYRSVVIFGRAEVVDSPAEKRRALDLFLSRISPQRCVETRPPNDLELKATLVLAFQLEEVSAKVRMGPPKDDEEDYQLPVWAGTVPLQMRMGTPEPDSCLDPQIPVPAYLSGILK